MISKETSPITSRTQPYNYAAHCLYRCQSTTSDGKGPSDGRILSSLDIRTRVHGRDRGLCWDAMNENSNVVPLRQPDEIDDPLTNILRSGARELLAQAVEMEAEAFLAAMKGLKLPDGRDRLVRHGHGPVRTIQTGIGAVEVARVKIRDRAAASDGERIRFTSAILALWARRTGSRRGRD